MASSFTKLGPAANDPCEHRVRKALTASVSQLLSSDDKTALLLGDIAVFSFEETLKAFPDRVFNLGILEQSMIGVAAGMARAGLTPIVHSIAPFLVERCYEQIKIDLAYQRLPAKLISVGASVDYAKLGPTHHCPGDVLILGAIPNVEIVVPGTGAEMSSLLSQSMASQTCTYFRLSEAENAESETVQLGTPCLLSEGNDLTVISVGPMKDAVMQATDGLDVSHIYLTSLRPLDGEKLKSFVLGHKVLIVEPLYSGSTASILATFFGDKFLQVKSLGFPRKFLTDYGTRAEHLETIGLTARHIREEVLASL